MRKELTDEWQNRGVKEGVEYAILTDEITKAWSGMSTRQYKNLKGLKKENLRDNMSTLELVLNNLAEATTTELSKTHEPQGLAENQSIARHGGQIAGNARKEIEENTGLPVIISKNVAELNAVVTKLIEETDKKQKKEYGILMDGKEAMFLMYRAADEDVSVNALIKDESIWLSQKGMAELFECTTDNISLHLKNIFLSGELEKESVTEKISATAADGKNYPTQYRGFNRAGKHFYNG